jgi:hypothetical protein
MVNKYVSVQYDTDCILINSNLQSFDTICVCVCKE